MPSGQLPKSPVSSSLYDASLHAIVGSPHLRLGKVAFSDAKRLSRQLRPFPDSCTATRDCLMIRWPARAALAALLGNAASDARAATAQGPWLVGVIIAARVDHNRAPLNVGHSEVRHYHGLRGLAASIDGQHGHVALMALAIRSEVFAGVGWVIMATRRHAGRWLAIRSRARATIRIYVGMESMVARR